MFRQLNFFKVLLIGMLMLTGSGQEQQTSPDPAPSSSDAPAPQTSSNNSPAVETAMIQIKGSDSEVNPVQSLAEEFMDFHHRYKLLLPVEVRRGHCRSH